MKNHLLNLLKLILVILMVSCNASKSNEKEQGMKELDKKEIITQETTNNESTNNSTENTETEITSKFEDEIWAKKFLMDSIISIDSFVEDFDSCCISDCENWNYPKGDEFIYVLSKMVWEHSMDINEIYNYVKCRLVGKITISSNKTYDFYFNAGGYIGLDYGSESFYLGCRDSTLKKYFLSIRPTQEEFEKMMTEE